MTDFDPSPSNNNLAWAKRRAWQIVSQEYSWPCEFDTRTYQMFNACIIATVELFLKVGSANGHAIELGDIAGVIPPESWPPKYPNDPEDSY